ncbi:transmembrane protein 100 [Centroberyx gerrardi]|uniref:transmembrane protein 100 n=1 Tax=Centroberyx gerrardi TaxID=166262 RepID=UPI003AABC8F7
MKTKLETLDPSALPSSMSAVTYDPKSETVILPGGVVSIAGITVVTGGAELSCGSCMMAFGVWGTLIGLSVVALGLWDQSQRAEGNTSRLLGLGWVILGISFGVVGSAVGFYLLMKRRREMTREQREDGKVVLVEESGRVIKTVTV